MRHGEGFTRNDEDCRVKTKVLEEIGEAIEECEFVGGTNRWVEQSPHPLLCLRGSISRRYYG